MPPRIPISSSLCSLPSRQRCLFTIDESASSLLLLQASTRPSHPSAITLPSRQQTRTIKSILKPPPKANRFDTSLGLSPSALSRSAVLERREHTLPHRTGVLAVKKGMSSMYATGEDQPGAKKQGHRIPVTILQLDRCQVMGHKTLPRHGYWAVQMGHGFRHPTNLTRPELGHLAAAGVPPKEKVMEFRIKGEEGLVPVGAELRADWFKMGQFVDVRSKNKGKGFAGGMKKHGWAGQPASHGQSLTHRTMGSAGGSQGSGSRVIPGKAMAGRMGHEFHTIQNLQVVMIDEANGIVAVKGCVSGPIGCIVQVQDAKKMPEQMAKLDLPALPVSLSAAAAQEAAIADVSL